jgi:hypothetical protein
VKTAIVEDHSQCRGLQRGQQSAWGRGGFLTRHAFSGLEGWMWVWEGALQKQGAVTPKQRHNGTFQELQEVCALSIGKAPGGRRFGRGGGWAGNLEPDFKTQVRKCL